MNKCREVLANRVSVMIFPEGTRSATAELLPFKDGAFRLAIEAGVPILPLAVHGTATALPRHDWRFGRSAAVVKVLEPVETAGLAIGDLQALKATSSRDDRLRPRRPRRERLGTAQIRRRAHAADRAGQCQ